MTTKNFFSTKKKLYLNSYFGIVAMVQMGGSVEEVERKRFI
jgi:hypothetical protein